MNRAAVLEGLGAMVPPRRVTNEELAQLFDTNDAWIRSRTGISSRHWADPGTATSDLAVVAGRQALASADVSSVDLLVLATSTPNQVMPATAPEVADRLGLGTPAAYDMSVACAGFIYGLSAAAGAIASGTADRVLVIGADLWSTRLNPDDRGTAVIFGDGAGAAVVRAGTSDEPGALAGFDLGSDGAHYDLAMVPGHGSRRRTAPEDEFMYMRGKEVFTHAVNRMSESSRDVLKLVEWEPDSVASVVGHQANARILRMVADVLGISDQRLVLHLDRVGNTSAASIPLALTDAAAQNRFTPGDRLLLTAFGGGLNWGSAALTWPDLTVSPVIAA